MPEKPNGMHALTSLIEAWIKSASGPSHMKVFIPDLQTAVTIRGYKKIILERDFERGKESK